MIICVRGRGAFGSLIGVEGAEGTLEFYKYNFVIKPTISFFTPFWCMLMQILCANCMGKIHLFEAVAIPLGHIGHITIIYYSYTNVFILQYSFPSTNFIDRAWLLGLVAIPPPTSLISHFLPSPLPLLSNHITILCYSLLYDSMRQCTICYCRLHSPIS